MEKRVDIVAAITHSTQLESLRHQTRRVDLLEVRADLLQDPLAVRHYTRCPLVYTLRSKSQGGNFEGAITKRHQLLIEASFHFDFVELEGETDLLPELLETIPKEKRRIAWYGPANNKATLLKNLEGYMDIPAHRYKIVMNVNSYTEAIPIVQLLDGVASENVIAYAVGFTSEWTQLIAPFLGAPEVPARIENEYDTGAYFSPKQLITDYGLPFIYPLEKLYGIVGNPVLGSISPEKHNEAYRYLGLPYLYLPFTSAGFESFRQSMMDIPSLSIPLAGLTVVAPFKELGYRTSVNKLGGDAVNKVCNGLRRQDDGWHNFSTDAFGALAVLQDHEKDWRQKNIVIIGCGGAGRSIAYALCGETHNLTLVNRTKSTGMHIATTLNLPFIALEDFNADSFDIIIHATPLGKHAGETPFLLSQLKSDSLVIDNVYSRDRDTDLVAYCKLNNIKVVDGKEIARLQIRQQFTNLTDIEMPIATEPQPIKLN